MFVTFFLLDIPLKERQEVELLEQVLKKALKIRSHSAVGINYQENTCSSGRASKVPAVKDGDKKTPQKSSSSSCKVKGCFQHTRHLKSTAGCGDVATCQVLVKTRQSPQPLSKGKQSGMKPYFIPKKKATVQIKTLQKTCFLESDRGMMSGLFLEERTSHSHRELTTQSEASAPKEQW